MDENRLFDLIIGTLGPMVKANGGPTNLQVVRGFQVSQQGRVEDPAIMLARQALKQYGSPRDSYQQDPGNPANVLRINEQVIVLQVQFQARLTYKPEVGKRPADLLGLASRIMGTPAWREAMRAEGVQCDRIQDNALTYNVNDRDQYEPVPVVLATFIYTDRLVTSAPTVTKFRTRIERI